MNSLVGVFIQDEIEQELVDESNVTLLHPFTLIFPSQKIRTYYLTSKEEKEEPAAAKDEL